MQASGILAAVAAGITMSYVELSGNAQATIRVQRWAVWETVQFTFNGIIFVLLGEQLPGILDDLVHSAQQAGHMNVGWLLVDVAVISAGLMLLRFYGCGCHCSGICSKRCVAASSVSVRRGRLWWRCRCLGCVVRLLWPGADIAVVDAGWYAVMARQLVIFLAASVILVSLLLASVALPYLLRGLELPEKSSYDKEEDFARKVSAQAALEAVERLRQRLVEDSANAERYNEAAHQVSQLYQRKLGAVDLANVDPQETKVFEQVVRRFRQVGLAAERDELFRLAREHNISDELLQRMVRNLDLIEARRRS